MTLTLLDRANWPALLRFACGYWFIYLMLNCILWSLAGVDLFESLPFKLILVAVCFVMALVVSLVLKTVEGHSVPYRASLSLCLSVAAAILFVIVDHINLMIHVYPEAMTLDPAYIGLSMIEGVAIFFGWACLSMMFLAGPRTEEVIDSPKTTSPTGDLTARQREILVLLLDGKSNKEIARELSISPLTVRNHISVLFRQFGVKRRKDLASKVVAIDDPLSV